MLEVSINLNNKKRVASRFGFSLYCKINYGRMIMIIFTLIQWEYIVFKSMLILIYRFVLKLKILHRTDE